MGPKEQRAYKACVNCRRRKHKCEFDPEAPPWVSRQNKCRRCVREGRDCVMAPTRALVGRPQGSSALRTTTSLTPENTEPEMNWHDTGQSIELAGPSAAADLANQPVNANEDSTSDEQAHGAGARSEEGHHQLSESNADTAIADSQLQNPSDALDLLARVAHGSVSAEQQTDTTRWQGPPKLTDVSQRSSSLLTDLDLPEPTIRFLLKEYYERYHPFLPIANDDVLNGDKIEISAEQQPHLFLVLLTIASKQDPSHAHVHQICSETLQTRLSKLIYNPPAAVEAVEALLLLAEWTPQRFQSQRNVGTGEEDRAAWMQVGLAIRLAYLQELDLSSFAVCSKNESQTSKRQRVAWAACFMSDRQISIRVGKAFWSRGPGPASVLTFDDYIPFRQRPPRFDDYSSVFQAHLELTKLFSNAHDVLYASGSHRDQLFKTGEYAKYIDDFRLALSNWHDRWGSLSCSPGVKASLIISYEYLRLYITSFAYQATLSRISIQRQQHEDSNSRTPYLATHLAGSTDARFIYEAVNAAKTLLSTFNSFVDPAECSRYMPIKYYLYVIFSAVFLYKTKATGVLNSNTKNGIENLISQTILMLKQSSSHPEDVGSRHSNLLALLWKKTLRRNPRQTRLRKQDHANHMVVGSPRRRRASTHAFDTIENIQHEPDGSYAQQPLDQSRNMDLNGLATDPINCTPDTDMFPIDMFSWRDLEAVGQFAMAANRTNSNDNEPVAPSFADEFLASGAGVAIDSADDHTATPGTGLWEQSFF